MNFDWAFLAGDKVAPKLLGGLATTLELFGVAWIGGFLVALVIVSLRAMPFRPLDWLLRLIVEYHRNVPTVVQIMVWYFGIPELLPEPIRVWVNQSQSEFIFAAIALSLNVSAYFSEDIRSGFRSVPEGQILAAKALGLSPFAALRHVILPQALRIAVPPLLNRTLILFKDTSLAMVIGVADLTYQVKAIENLTFRSLEVFAAGTVTYLALSLILMAIAAWVGRRFPAAAAR